MRGDARVIVQRVDIERWEEQEQIMTPGSTIDTCRVCDGAVWLSPEGHHFAYVKVPDDSEIVCVECHIRLEIERAHRGDDRKRIKAGTVPGANVSPKAVATFDAVVEILIQAGADEQAAQELARPLPAVREVSGELDDEVVGEDQPPAAGDEASSEPQDGDQEGDR